MTDWKHVQGFPGYSVNFLGQVRKDSNERLLVPRYNQYGVPYVGLMTRDWDRPIPMGDDRIHYPPKQCIRSLPRLVALAFLPPPTEIFDTPVQIDGNRANCHADNLMWRPRWYAVLYKRQFETERYDNPILSPVRAVGETEVFEDSLAAGCRYGLLEREVVLSVLNHVPTWPTYQQFELAYAA